MPSWKKVIISGSNAALNSLTVSNGITGSLFGTSSWAVNAQTASFITASNVYGPFGSNSVATASYATTASFSLATTENRILVINKSGATISKGMVVHLTGSNNSSDTPYVITASYESDSLSANTLGIASQTIAFNSTGYITTEGVLTGIDVTGLVSGQLIYLGATGSITGSAPVAPLHSVRLGQVVRDSPSNNGAIYVRIDNGYELGELHDIIDRTTTSSYGDLLVKSGSVWTNSRQLTGSYGLTGSLQATSFTGSLFGTASTSTTTAAVAGTTNYVPKFTSGTTIGNSQIFDNGSQVGIGMTIPNTYFGVRANYAVSSLVDLENTNATGNAAIDLFNAGTFIGTIGTDKALGLQYDAWNTGNHFFKTFGTTRMFISGSGNIGIRTTTPTSASLHVSGNVFATSFTGSLSGTASYASQALSSSFAISSSYAEAARTVGITLQDTTPITYNVTFAGASSGNQSLNVDTTALTYNPSTSTLTVPNLAGTASWATNATSASFALTASFVNPLRQTVQVTGSLNITGSSDITGPLNVTNSSGPGISMTAATVGRLTYQGQRSVDWTSRVLQRSNNNISLNWENSTLNDANEATVLSWANGLTGSIFGTSSYATLSATASFVTGSNVFGPFGSNSITSASFAVSSSRTVSSSFASTASFVNTLNQNVLITGSLTVGATSTGASENTLTLGPSPAGGTGEGGQLGLNAQGGTYTSASFIDTWQNYVRILKGTNASSTGLVAQWNLHNTQMNLPGYNSPTSMPGTVSGLLAFDTSGNVITTTTGSGGGGGVTINNNTDNYIVTATGTANTLNGESGLQYNGTSLSVTGQVTASGAIISTANGAMYFRGGDDAEFWDINVANTVGIYGQQNADRAGLKLGSSGPTLFGSASRFGIGTITPTSASLTVEGNVWATSFTGSLFGTASWANNATSATTATNANNVAVTDTTTGTGPYYLMFADGTTGNRAVRVDSSTLQFNATTNTLTVPNLAGTASWATNALTASFATTASFLNSTTNAFIQNGNSFGTTALLGTNDNQPLALETNGTTRMFISSSGNVGIGTTTPTSRFTIDDSTAFSWGFPSAASAKIGTPGTGGSFMVMTPSLNSSYESGFAVDGTYTSGKSVINLSAFGVYSGGPYSADIAFKTATNTTLSEKMRITNDGNVGIGTSTPGNLLTVSGNTRLVTGTTQGLFAYDAATGGSFIWSLTRYTDTNANDLNVNTLSGFGVRTGVSSLTNSGHQFYINSSGNVGIGTTSPSGRLHVTDANKTFDGYGNVNIFTSDAAAVDKGGSIAFGGVNATGGTSPYVFAKIQGIKEGSTLNYNGALILGTTSNSSAVTEKMRITAAGDVGIGLSSPSQKLDVYGVAVFGTNTARYTTIGGSSGTMYTQGEVGGWAFGHHAKGSSGTDRGGFGWLGSSDAISYYYIGAAYNTATMYITSGSSSAVGIGTSSPTAKLNVIGDIHLGSYSNSSTVNLENRTNKGVFTISTDGVTNAAGTTITYSWANGGHGPLKFNNASNEVMRLDANGNLGIGTSSPSKKLDVSGSDALINGVTVGRGAGNIASNTVIGSGSLSSITTGGNNTAIGYATLASSTAGGRNTAVGRSALTIATGDGNLGIGYNAGASITSGNYNNIIGSELSQDPTDTGFNGSYTLSIGKNSGDFSGLPHIWSPETVTISNSTNATVIRIEPTRYSAFFIEYVIDDLSGNMRSGTLKGIFTSNINDIQWAEVDELTIGNTSLAIFSVVDSGAGQIDVKLDNTTGATMYCNFTSRLILRKQ